ncbi:MAG: shikimate dehydrogenase family protein [Cyclobacteriaceae bacterium]
MKLFGLIGFPLSHSFSRKYFLQKFDQEGISDCDYQLFPIENVDELPKLIQKHPNLKGLNVTIPYKQQVIPFLWQISDSAEKIGAVNVIKIENGQLYGFNSDYYGFKQSLINFIPGTENIKALVLGTGGAAKAVKIVLQDLRIEYLPVSRGALEEGLTYQELEKKPEVIAEHQLIINTTPLGMSPAVDTAPHIDYQLLTDNHYLFDLVYNPEETLFMQFGSRAGAKVKNGLEMLYLQAEKSWEIWNG